MKQLILFFGAMLLSLQLTQAQCTENCVWPGDLNANGIANNLDFLALGFSFQSTGSTRDNPSVTWEPLQADNWGMELPFLNADFKHSDADGNGVIDEADRFPISINYNQTNDNFTELLGNTLQGDDLFAVLIDSVTSPGGSLFFDIHLGTEINSINDMYGIGFQIAMDTQYVENVLFDYSASWLGEPEELLAYEKISDELDHAAVAITRFDGNSVNGFGRIARVEIVITDVVLGLESDTTTCLPFPIEFKQVYGINNNEEDQIITAHGDSMTLKHASQLTNTRDLIEKNLGQFTVYPNPTSGELTIESVAQSISNVTLYNQIGASVLQKKQPSNSFNQSMHLSLNHLPKGIYFLVIENEKSRLIERVLIE